ncbi:hypothetical protein FKW77_007289 [Venturia effusa]|uniref:Uncharacterized protein n=1 Tax=Venturia effusa TaxID=50376 RepID=A0A517KWR9_9PEZI|nr:hypothetical protein FKW77_007289 [Venturia effusa]
MDSLFHRADMIGENFYWPIFCLMVLAPPTLYIAVLSFSPDQLFKKWCKSPSTPNLPPLTTPAVQPIHHPKVLRVERRDYKPHKLPLHQNLSEKHHRPDSVNLELDELLQDLRLATQRIGTLEKENHQLTINSQLNTQRLDAITKAKDEVTQTLNLRAKQNIKLRAQIDALKATAEKNNQTATKLTKERLEILRRKNAQIEELTMKVIAAEKGARKKREEVLTYRFLVDERWGLEERGRRSGGRCEVYSLGRGSRSRGGRARAGSLQM